MLRAIVRKVTVSLFGYDTVLALAQLGHFININYEEDFMIKRDFTGHRLANFVTYNGVTYLSGQVPTTTEENITLQTEEVLAKIDELLEKAGSCKENILSAQIWLKDMAQDFAAFNEIWEAWIGDNEPPARAAVEANMARPHVLVEIMITAAVRF